MNNVIEIKQIINHKPMNSFQLIAIAVCVLISFIDGFDVLTIAFVAPSISEQWSLQPTSLGMLFSAGLVGMVIGALIISPFADKFGRRSIILFCLLILSLGMLASGLSTTLLQLTLSRLFTGLGMGAILPGLNTIVAEYSSDRYRSLSISIFAAGYTVGGLVGGSIAKYFIASFGWQYVFYFGSIFSLIMIPLVLLYLPESLDFILTRNKNSNKTLKQLNKLLAKLDVATCSSMPNISTNKPKHQAKISLLLTPKILKNTVLLCVSNFMLMCSFYFLATWLPKILVGLGYSKDIGITGMQLMNVFGIIGGLSLGWLSKKYSVQKITGLLLLIAFIATVAFGFSHNELVVLFIIIVFIGFAIFGAMAGLYATAPIVFPSEIRATGTGLVLGLARFGAALGPYIAGLLIAQELSRSAYFFILAMPLLIGAICIIKIKPMAKIEQ